MDAGKAQTYLHREYMFKVENEGLLECKYSVKV
jgi:hypothetical protein